MEETDRSTRRGFCALAVAFVTGCVSDPGASCRGSSVRLSFRPTSTVDSPLSFDPETLSSEAIVLIETAIADEHVEHCVSWNPSAGETGPSAGLAEVADRIEAHTRVPLGSEPSVEADARFRGEAYELTLVVDGDGSR